MGFLPQRPPCPLATVLSLQSPSPFCDPERSRGICSSADLSWKCFRIYWATIVTVTGMVCGGMQELESQAW
jgi:hypothetical protein